MTPNCRDELSAPHPNHLPAIILEAEAKPCPLKASGTSMHTTTVDNQRAGIIYDVEITVKSRFQGIIFDNNPSVTEHTHTVSMIKSGGKHSPRSVMTKNTANTIPTDEIAVGFVLYDRSQYVGGIHGKAEKAGLSYTIDIL